MNTRSGPARTVGGALMPLLLVLAAASCGDLSTRPGPTAITYLSIEGPVAVVVGRTASFKAVLEDSAGQPIRDVTQDVQWSSSEPTVLSIDRGLARGLTWGQAVLQVRLGEQTVAFRVGVQTVVLAIERLSAKVFGPDQSGHFWYEPRFLLTETSGNIGATIQDILVQGPNESEQTGPGCWREPLRVPPGGTLDIFYTDAGLQSLTYCAPGCSGRAPSAPLRVVVSFIDDGGHPGTVQANVNAVK